VTSIDGSTRIYGVFGYPVQHSLSPRLHNAVFEKRGINAVYVPFEIRPDYFVEAVGAMKAFNIAGANVTVPHKEHAATFVDEIPLDVDRAIGAINTLVVKNGLVQGFNTDGPAFIEDLREVFGFEAKGKTALVLGSGGAARAIAFYLLKESIGELFVYNRTPERATGLVEYLARFFPKARVRAVLSIEELLSERIDLTVNATSCGLKPDDPFPVNPEILAATGIFYEAIYAPETRLLGEARKRGVRAGGGAGMLIRQAVLAEQLWFPGAPKREIFQIMKEAYDACRI